MVQEMEITKVNDGFTAQQLRDALKFGENLVGKDYLIRMNELRILGDASFVAEINGGVYLISYYVFENGRPKNPPPIRNISSLNEYMVKLTPFFNGQETVRLPVANSFWINANIKEQLG